MKAVGGNVTADFLTLSASRNGIGEMTPVYSTIATCEGWLDYSSGTSTYNGYSAKTEESTHVFVCDFFDADLSQVSRLSIGGRTFDVLYSDHPMGLGYHYEIFLKEVVQDGK